MRVQALPPHQRTIWWRSAAAAPATTPLAGSGRFDVAVVGAGFTGLTAAWHLARRGARVVLLEAGRIASGASGLNAGFVVPSFAKADPADVIAALGEERGSCLLALVGAGADRVFGTIRDHAIDCDAEQAGWMHVAHSAQMLQALGVRVEAWQRLGRPVRLLDERAARALSGTRHCHGALFDPSGGTLHPLNYAYGLARLAMAAGCVIHENATVRDVQRHGRGWQLQAGGHLLQAEQVLLCTHAAEPGIARRLSRVVLPLRVVQLATRPLAAAVVRRISPQRTPVADTRANLFTYRLDREDRLISGAMPMLGHGAEGRIGPMIARRLQHELQLPEQPPVECVWRGRAAMTTDFLPHLYEFGPGFIGGVGCNGRGIGLTAMLGEVLADAATGRQWDELPVTKASTEPLPLRALAGAATAAAVARARWQDWRQGL